MSLKHWLLTESSKLVHDVLHEEKMGNLIRSRNHDPRLRNNQVLTRFKTFHF